MLNFRHRAVRSAFSAPRRASFIFPSPFSSSFVFFLAKQRNSAAMLSPVYCLFLLPTFRTSPPLFSLCPFVFNSSSRPRRFFLILPLPSFFLFLHAPLRQIARHDNQRMFAMFLGTMARRESQVEREFLDTALAGLGLGDFTSLPVVLWRRTRVWRVLYVHVCKINRPKCTPSSVRQALIKVK